MKFTKFGKALLLSALSAAVALSVTSCVQSYTVGYLYVTGTITSGTAGNGIISGFNIDHNTGKLNPIDGLPISSGGANPGRAVLVTGSRFLYVLNRGVNSLGNADCYGTGANECQNANITEFAVGGNGILTPEQTFFTQGLNPFRLIGDASGEFLYVLDHDSPSNAACALALGPAATTCGDITAFTINQNSAQIMGISQGTAIVNGTGFVYLLDNEGTDVAGTGATSQILPYSVGTNGALQAQTGGVIPDDATLANPIYLLVESKGKFLYVANQGNNVQGTNTQSGLSGYVIDPTTHQLSFIAGEPFGSGAGPQCLVEDPSDQFIYSADFNDSSVTGRVVDPNSGVLNNLRVTSTFALQGPAAWCLIDGRTS